MTYIKGQAQKINSNIAEHDNMEKLRNINKLIISPPEDLIVVGRRLVREGRLIK